jgi:hypothetical protein
VYVRRAHSFQSSEYLRSIAPGQNGATNPNARLTDARALAIFHATGKYAVIAIEHGVSEAHVGKIKRKELWKHLHSQTHAESAK